MSFQPVHFKINSENKCIGHKKVIGNVLFFFGNKFGSSDLLEKIFSELIFRKLNQVHGDVLVKATASDKADLKLQEADAHWTDQAGLALCIQTADCMPVLVSDQSRILAIHSGWRGTLKNIIGKSVQNCFFSEGHADSQKTNLFIGPSIQNNSFEVGLDVANDFKLLFSPHNPDIVQAHPTGQADKAHVDLAIAARAQSLVAGLSDQNIDISSVDTKTTADYASYRRDKGQAVRNISFVARLK